jgi:hypothetical protein
MREPVLSVTSPGHVQYAYSESIAMPRPPHVPPGVSTSGVVPAGAQPPLLELDAELELLEVPPLDDVVTGLRVAGSSVSSAERPPHDATRSHVTRTDGLGKRMR